MNKRKIQEYLRYFRSLLRGRGWNNKYLPEILNGVSVQNPPPFQQKAIFNFSIDFELFWGNGNRGGFGYSLNERIEMARQQRDNFPLFLEIFKKLRFPNSWALPGILFDRESPAIDLRYNPKWTNHDWYKVPSEIENDKELWDGRFYLEQIQKQDCKHEILTHTFIHADYTDPNMTLEKAKWDLEKSQRVFKNLELTTRALVFPCNKLKYPEILKENNIKIFRGPNSGSWEVYENDIIGTPLGFWMSPGRISIEELFKIVDLGIKSRSFIHPWMHLIECDKNQNDLEKVYLPFFEYVLEKEAKGELEILLFDEIASRYLKYRGVK